MYKLNDTHVYICGEKIKIWVDTWQIVVRKQERHKASDYGLSKFGRYVVVKANFYFFGVYTTCFLFQNPLQLFKSSYDG